MSVSSAEELLRVARNCANFSGWIRPHRRVCSAFAKAFIGANCATAADFEVRSPIVDVHEFEYDAKFAQGFDRKPLLSRGRSIVNEFEYGVSDWWSPAIEGEWGRQPGSEERSSLLLRRGENGADSSAIRKARGSQFP